MNGVGHGKPGDPMFTLQAAAQHGVCIANNTGAGFWTEDDKAGCLRVSAAPKQPQTLIAGTVSSKWAKGTGGPAGDECQNLVTHSLRGEGFDASEDGTGRGTPLAVVAFKPAYFADGRTRPSGAPSDVAHPLGAETKEGDQSNVVAYRTSGNCNAVAQGDKTAALNTATDPNQNIVAFQTRIARNGRGQPESVVPALSGADAGATSDMRPCVASRTMVRRLTPIECARLQAHPDDFAVWGLDAAGNRVDQSDSQQYRQYGNGVTTTVLNWIAKRAAKYLKP